MRARYLERKLTGKCTRCGADAGDTNMCESHRLENNAAAAASGRKRRATARQQRALLTVSIARAA